MNDENCHNNHQRDNGLVISKGKYNAIKWLGLLTGVSVKPDKVLYQCTICNQVFDETQEKEIINNFY